RLAQILGAAGDADAHLVGLVGVCRHLLGRDLLGRDLRPVQGIDADQIEAQFACSDAGQPQALADDVERQPAARQRAGTGIGDLASTDETVDKPARAFQRIAPLPAAPAADAHAILRDFRDLYFRKIRNDIRLEILPGVVHLVEQLLLAGPRGYGAAA